MEGGENMREYYEIPPLCLDYGFKSIFSEHDDVLCMLINDITGYQMDNITIKSGDISNKTPLEKAKQCDFLITSGDKFLLNLEINTSYYKSLIIKNACYVFDIYATHVERGKNYDSGVMVIQLNINCFKRYDEDIIKYQVYDINNINNLFVDNLQIFDFYE